MITGPTHCGTCCNVSLHNIQQIYLLQLWEEVTNIQFIPATNSCNLDIEILFAVKEHNDTERYKRYLVDSESPLVAHDTETDSLAFDGPGKTLAHAFYPQFGGDVHFDDEEIWTIDAREGRKICINTYTYINMYMHIYIYVYI